jgi:hypothetical protein
MGLRVFSPVWMPHPASVMAAGFLYSRDAPPGIHGTIHGTSDRWVAGVCYR